MAPLFFSTPNYFFQHTLFGIPTSALKTEFASSAKLIVATPLFIGAFVGYTFKIYSQKILEKRKRGAWVALQRFQRWWREMAVVM